MTDQNGGQMGSTFTLSHAGGYFLCYLGLDGGRCAFSVDNDGHDSMLCVVIIDSGLTAATCLFHLTHHGCRIGAHVAHLMHHLANLVELL